MAAIPSPSVKYLVGEYLLLLNLQKVFFRCSQNESDNAVSKHLQKRSILLQFNTLRSHTSLVTSEDSTVVHHFGPKVWANSYVGVDRHSGVLIGNRSLWHNKSKIVSDYGPGFTSNSIIILCNDSTKGWGVTFRSALTSSAVTSLSRTTENNATVEGAEIF
eukprot:gene14946-16636_t